MHHVDVSAGAVERWRQQRPGVAVDFRLNLLHCARHHDEAVPRARKGPGAGRHHPAPAVRELYAHVFRVQVVGFLGDNQAMVWYIADTITGAYVKVGGMSRGASGSNVLQLLGEWSCGA